MSHPVSSSADWSLLLLASLTLSSSDQSAVLRTPEKTYSLRQKNTSNALILLSPANTPASAGQIPQLGLSAIATLHETIELTPEDPNAAPVAAVRGKWHEKFGKNR